MIWVFIRFQTSDPSICKVHLKVTNVRIMECKVARSSMTSVWRVICCLIIWLTWWSRAYFKNFRRVLMWVQSYEIDRVSTRDKKHTSHTQYSSSTSFSRSWTQRASHIQTTTSKIELRCLADKEVRWEVNRDSCRFKSKDTDPVSKSLAAKILHIDRMWIATSIRSIAHLNVSIVSLTSGWFRWSLKERSFFIAGSTA